MKQSKSIACIFLGFMLAMLYASGSRAEDTPYMTVAEELELGRATYNPTKCVGEETKQNESGNPTREVTEEEYNLLLRVCMSECGGIHGEPMAGKIAVVETILNRVDMGMGTIEEVINAPNQYSTANNGEPDASVMAAVDAALSGDRYPDNMIYFRADHYHTFGQPYEQIGNHYFSTTEG